MNTFPSLPPNVAGAPFQHRSRPTLRLAWRRRHPEPVIALDKATEE